MGNENDVNMTAKVTFPDGNVKTYRKGISFLELGKDYAKENYTDFLGVKVNNVLTELSDVLKCDSTVEFFDVNTIDGNKYYSRSLKLLLYRAVRDIYGKCDLRINQTVNKGTYCTISDQRLSQSDISKIKAKMLEIVEKNELIERESFRKKDAMNMMAASGLEKKVKLFKYKNASYVSLYKLGWVYDYLFGFMVPSTGYIKDFDLIKEEDGFMLMQPCVYGGKEIPKVVKQKKLFDVTNETAEWAKILGIETIGDLNEAISNNRSGEIIRIAEAMQEKKLANIVDMIIERKSVKLVLIAGPSSSGKTTSANRLAVQLSAAGKKPIVISLDNYYLERGDDKYPKDENGKPDWEALKALNIELFNENMNDLMSGKEVVLPTFDFATGKRVFEGKPMKLEDNTIMVVEGIHGLNEELTHTISKDKKFKIYVSALTPLGFDEHNRISTSDSRLLRRLVRDSKFRAYPAIRTLDVWESVRKGEEKNIFPFQEEADIMFNTALVYELPILKQYAEPMLYGVPEDSVYSSEAKRLIKMLSYVLGLDSEAVPPNSLLREFIGGSCFY